MYDKAQDVLEDLELEVLPALLKEGHTARIGLCICELCKLVESSLPASARRGLRIAESYWYGGNPDEFDATRNHLWRLKSKAPQNSSESNSLFAVLCAFHTSFTHAEDAYEGISHCMACCDSLRPNEDLDEEFIRVLKEFIWIDVPSQPNNQRS